ncbi:Ger(x)C family spore germination protein [Alkalihalobacterium sp. APHAB7]|uniref:Ger(x)C family spore germination protein n=1 Tax=Alkalihalobacterium sp. APHAB7 TaxID=3402081 RepID=UPI003AAA4D48
MKLTSFISTLIIIFNLMLLTACGDIKNIEDLNYVTAIGIDFRDGKYIGYVQMVGFPSEAGSAGEGGGEEVTMYVASGEGSTFNESLFQIYRTAQERIIWAHVTSIVITEEALAEGFENIFDGITRYEEFRLTPWIFATKEPIEDIFTTSGFFNQALNTILHNPTDIHEQSSILAPQKLFEFASNVYEPNYTVNIPTIKVNDTQWKKNKNRELKLEYDGAFFMQGEELKAYFPIDTIKGYRWISPDSVRLGIPVSNPEDPYFLLVVKDPSISTDIIGTNENIEFEFNLRAKGYIVVRDKNKVLNYEEMVKVSEEAIKKEIEDLYKLGLEENIDFFNLEHTLYRKKPYVWKDLSKSGQKDNLKELKLTNINVTINIKHTSASKNKQLRTKNK